VSFSVLTARLVLPVSVFCIEHCESLSVAWLLQLLMAVGAVQIARPVVDYKRYLSHEADCHSEGVFIVYYCSSTASHCV